MRIVQCIVCGVEFQATGKRGPCPKTCSQACYGINQDRMREASRQRRRKAIVCIQCIVCGVEFQPEPPQTRTCSQACCDEHKREYQLHYNVVNRERVRERKRHYAAFHRERKREQCRRYYTRVMADPERSLKFLKRLRENATRWRATNLEKARERERERRRKHPRNLALENERGRRKYHNNLDKYRARNRRKNNESFAALAVFRQLIGPCHQRNRYTAKRILQQLGEQS
jgi:hypothetical protein